MKQYLEIELKDGVDPFDIQQFLSGEGCLKIHVIDGRSIRIWFNDIKITPKRVVSLVSQAAKQLLSKAA